MVEAFPINSDNGTLRYKCVGVDIFNQSEDDGRLPLFGKHKHHFHFSACVEAGCIDDRHSTVRVFVDVPSYLLIFIGYDKKRKVLQIRIPPSPSPSERNNWR